MWNCQWLETPCRSWDVPLSHWGHWVIEVEWRIYASGDSVIIGADNGLSPMRRQAIIWTNAGILLIGPLGTNFSEILIDIHTFPYKEMHLKMSSGWRPFCLGLNVFTYIPIPRVQWWIWQRRRFHASLRNECRKELAPIIYKEVYWVLFH